MYPISNAVKALFEAEENQVLRITGTDANGVAISITDANVMMDGFNIDRFSCNGNKLEIGTACASELTLKLDNRQGQYSGIVFEGAELFVEVGIGSPVNWIPCGYFMADEQPRSLSTITIKALDRMTRFDAVPPTLTPWTTQSGQVITTANGEPIYFVSNVRFPITVANLVSRVALLCNVPFTQSLTSFPNYNYTIQALPTLQQDITFRNIIQWCAGIMGTNAWIDWTGSLRFSWYGATTGYTTTTANRFSSDLFEDDITLTGVTYTNTQGVSIVSGSPEYALDMTGNYMAASGISTILPNIKNRINGFTYRPFTASVINAPYLWPMDMITFNKDGVNHTCAVTNVNFGINGTTELAGKGETAQTNSGTAPSGMTTEQGYLIEKAAENAAENVRQLDESLNQESIFNRLTDNGETQGLILYDGKVYLNASYIQTGTLVADFIKGGTLTLGGLNNTNGVLQVLDASGNVIGTWNKDGIGMFAGYINISTYQQSGNGTVSVIIARSYEEALNIRYSYNDNDYYGYMRYDKVGLRIQNIGPYGSGITNINGERITIENYDDSSNPQIEVQRNYTSSTGYREYTRIGPGTLQVSRIISSSITNVLNVIANSSAQKVDVKGDFTVTGTKSRSISTDQYSDRLLYCYETPTPMFGDIGEGTIGEDGLCYISLDAVFAQTVVTQQYQVFLQRYGEGECWVRERKSGYFIVQGTPGLAFGWEIKAKQRDYDQLRLERADEPFAVPEQSYGADAAKYIDDIRKERIPA